MDTLHRETRRLLLDARSLHESLEAAAANPSLDPAASAPVSAALTERLSQLSQKAAALRRAAASEPPSRREVWRARLRDLDDQVAELQALSERCSKRLAVTARDQRLRDELLARRRGISNGNVTLSVGGDGGGGGGRMRAVEEGRRLDESNTVVGGILNSGKQTLGNLMDQRERLRSARRRVLDVLHQVGVDRQLIQRIERREYSDMLLMYALMAAILLLLALAVLWKYHRRRHSM